MNKKSHFLHTSTYTTCITSWYPDLLWNFSLQKYSKIIINIKKLSPISFEIFYQTSTHSVASHFKAVWKSAYVQKTPNSNPALKSSRTRRNRIAKLYDIVWKALNALHDDEIEL